MADDIVEADDGAGNKYYVNQRTGQTGWSREELLGDPIQAVDDGAGNTYYVNSVTGATGWSREEVGGAAESLPDGVVSGYDESSGYTYYSNTRTGATGWSVEEVADPEPELGDIYGAADAAAADEPPSPAEAAAPPPKRGDFPGAGVAEADCFEDAKDGARLRTRGVLLKKGGGSSLFGRRNWQYRHFVLDLKRSELKYFSDETLKVQKGSVFLGGLSKFGDGGAKTFRGKHGKGSDAAEAYYFSLELVIDGETRKPKKDGFALRAPDQAQFDEWRASIQCGGDPKLKKYEMMLMMHLPQGAVEQKMRAEGVDPALLFGAGSGGSGGGGGGGGGAPAAPPAPAAAAVKPGARTTKLKKFNMMLKMHLPQGAVEQKMRAEGLDPALLFGASVASPAPKKVSIPPPTKKAAAPAGGGGDLLSQIQAGKKLKKKSTAPPAPKPAAGGGMDLMAQIAAGKQLKKAKPKAAAPPPAPKPAGGGGGGSLADAIAASQKRRAAKLGNLP
ncbi:hypothetical protein SO694_00032229 [Aureococcus anophagefferens]|uniref:PH domain-containing protein n=1 Tax=Aureococcus anophagefferens TaxID=44056 RepID=A0ABR1FKC4_AURAN